MVKVGTERVEINGSERSGWWRRQVSRHPRAVNASDETMAADLLDAEATAHSVAGSDTVYLLAGLT
jgi:hypothetical protein